MGYQEVKRTGAVLNLINNTQALETTRQKPEQVITDKEASYPSAIEKCWEKGGASDRKVAKQSARTGSSGAKRSVQTDARVQKPRKCQTILPGL